MANHASDSGAANSSADGRLHSGGGREMLEVPEGGSLADRLTMLNVGAPNEGRQREPLPRHNTPGSSVGGVEAPSGRSGWGGVKQEGPNLMEQMMAAAGAAKEEKIEEERRKHRKDTKKKFGGGLKMGFLSAAAASAPAAAAARENKKTSKAANSGSSSSKSCPSTGRSKESIPVVSGRAAPSGGGLEFDLCAETQARNTGLVLPEVQEAMERSTGKLGGDGGGAGTAGSDWLTPELFDKISRKPRLAAMLTDPRFAEAMQLMSTRPQDAVGMFASSPEARDSFTELMALLSEHFTEIGVAADKRAAAEEADRARVAEGPLAQKALERAAKGEGVAASPATAEDTASVERVLEKPELRELLMDPGMQKVLQECAEPAAFARYRRHPEYGPKLQLMARAGLVSFSS